MSQAGKCCKDKFKCMHGTIQVHTSSYLRNGWQWTVPKQLLKQQKIQWQYKHYWQVLDHSTIYMYVFVFVWSVRVHGQHHPTVGTWGEWQNWPAHWPDRKQIHMRYWDDLIGIGKAFNHKWQLQQQTLLLWKQIHAILGQAKPQSNAK